MLISKNRILGWIVFCLGVQAAADWPTYMADNSRSGVSADPVELSSKPAWVFEASHAPSSGFYNTLSEDTLGPQKIKAIATTFDFSFATVISDGRLYFGSSTEEALFCLDSKSGKSLWTFYTEGAVRLAPTVWDGHVYFGSDDGHVYCLNAVTGDLKWKFRAAPGDRRVIANGRMASQWPVRTAITIENGTAFFSAGLFPASGGVTLYGVDAKTGKPVWEQSIDLPPQGYILASGGELFVPNGRAAPAAYSQTNGTPRIPKSDRRREGGSSFVTEFDGVIAYGPTEYGLIRFRPIAEGPAGARKLPGKLTGLSGQRVVSHNDVVYFLRTDELVALKKESFIENLKNSALNYAGKGKKLRIDKSGVQQKTEPLGEKALPGFTDWSAEISGGRALILAGDAVIVGGKESVQAFDRLSGEQIMNAEVDGTVWELAASDGCIYASTDEGKIYCFGRAAQKGGTIRVSTGVSFADETQADYKQAAGLVLSKTDVQKGFCLVLGAGEGRLAYELAEQSGFTVICVEKDAEKVKQVRDRMAKAGVYGGRVVVHHQPEGKLPYIPYFANLIVSDGGEADFKPTDVDRLLQPYGGVRVRADGSMVQRGALDEAGEWTHMFADAGNTASSRDRLVGGTDYRLQWFGNPGDLRKVGWHYNGMGPLYKDGRLYMIKTDSIETVDSYNGTLLWQRDISGSVRFSPGREGGSACVDSDYLYMAVKNDCQMLDGETGEIVKTFFGPAKADDWGYIAVVDNLLYGSNQKIGATTTSYRYGVEREKGMWFATEVEFVVSHTLFALDRKTGKTKWEYSNGAILNSTISIDDDNVYFVESRGSAVTGDPDGSLILRDVLAEETFLVALDRKTGNPIWKKPFEMKTTTMLYLAVRDGTLVLSGAYHVGLHADKPPSGKASGGVPRKQAEKTLLQFVYRAVDTQDGDLLWDASYTSDGFFGNQHNYNVSHPVITEEAVWSAPAEQYVARIDLKAGEVKEYKSQASRNKGCHTPTGSDRAIFYRSLAIASFDIETEKQFYISSVSRPSCWMNIIPAGGMVQIPEYSYGCNCAFPLQTSMVFVPAEN